MSVAQPARVPDCRRVNVNTLCTMPKSACVKHHSGASLSVCSKEQSQNGSLAAMRPDRISSVVGDPVTLI